MYRKVFNMLSLLVVLAIMLSAAVPVMAAQDPASFTATPLFPDSVISVEKSKSTNAPVAGMVSVLVKLQGDSLADYPGDISGLAATSPAVTGKAKLDPNSNDSKAYLKYLDRKHKNFESEAKANIPDGQVTQNIEVILNAVAMVVPADQVSSLYTLPDVAGVYADTLLHVDTDNSPQFIGATTAWAQSGGQEKAGEGVIVGVIDTGIWPEHPSFSDPDPSGKPYSPPSGGPYPCDFGNTAWNANDVPFTCNNKLIGAYEFLNTYKAASGLTPNEYDSARDDDGHGTHTSSTSAGNAGVHASIFGVDRGVISGIAPRAKVIMYKACGAAGCYTSDTAAAIEQAILDGVDVINFSISGGANPYSDAVSLAFLDAYNAGVFVAASAGNSGPGADTTDHREPWTMTVAASTQNRAFQSTATLTDAGGASLTLTGASITNGVGPAPVFVPAPANVQCNTPFAANSVTGMVVVCQRGVTGRAEKGYNVLQGGAVGMILYNQSTSVTDLETDNHFLPATHIQYTDGQALLSFFSSHTNVQATLTQGVKVSAQGDVMASFSSRGGPGQSLGVSKPDITAPGVQILAGASPQHLPPTDGGVALGPQGELFQAIAGTSMSSPHIAGSGALLKALHPNWTPGQIKSAIMLSAQTNVVKEDGVTPANAFDDGSGRVDLNKASNVGFTFDETGTNYVADQTHLWDANYPSLYVPVMPGQITVQRTAHNETNQDSDWRLSVSAPSDVTVSVPNHLKIKKNQSASFSITVDARAVPLGQVRFATIAFKQGHDTLHFPITIVRKQPVVTLNKACDPASGKKGATFTCTITITNTTFSPATVNLIDKLPNQLDLATVTGGTKHDNTAMFNGTLFGAQPPDVTLSVGASPAGGYLPLSAFGIAPLSGAGDETIANFNVPAFQYAGETYTRIGVVSDGYLVVGGGTGADIQFINQSLPNATPPNNVLAPFWSDLNPAVGGAIRVASLTDGVDTWLVFDYDNVVNYSGGANTFEVWIQIGTTQGISYTYGPQLTSGEGGALTIGAENKFGNRGANYYFNGTGTFPGVNFDAVVVNSIPGTPGETHVITVTAKGDQKGAWTNCAQMTGNLFFGTNIACFSGQVTK